MQILYDVFKIIIIISLHLYLVSCSSSSYYERYGSTTKKKPVETKETTSISLSPKVEDEIIPPPSTVTKNETNLIISKLGDITHSNEKKEMFLNEIISYLNTPYRYGGESRNGIDCSAFTQKVYHNSLNIKLPRTAREQYRSWEIFNSKNKLKFGDLIYFNTSTRYFPGHVGIYLDKNLFAHASSSKGVIVSSLENNYYSSKFVGANRVKIK